MITAVALVMLAAPPPPTPTPTPPIRILLKSERDAGEKRPAAGSLSELAKRIKLKLPEDQPRRLTNESIKELAKGVHLTTALPYDGDLGAAGGAGVGAETDALREKWQERFQQSRAELAFWESEVHRLEGEVARLETKFYATDDPAYRDGVVKPDWDKALVDLREARSRLEGARARPEEVLNQARRDGALPGWFRGLPDPDPESVRPPAER